MCLRFQNLGIIHIARREVKEIIKQRKKAALIDHARLRWPDRSHDEIRQSITPTDMKKVRPHTLMPWGHCTRDMLCYQATISQL